MSVDWLAPLMYLLSAAMVAAFRQVAVDGRDINREQHHSDIVFRVLEWATTAVLLYIGLRLVLWVFTLA